MKYPQTIHSTNIFSGKLLNISVEDVKEVNGNIGKREIVKHPGGAVVVPLFPNNDIILVRQYRVPLKDFIIELPAGKLEKNEDPFECAKRELTEETGYTSNNITKLTTICTTPGFCDELLHIYLATNLELSPKGQKLDEGEEGLTILKINLSDAIKLIDEGKIIDAKTIIGILLTNLATNK